MTELTVKIKLIAVLAITGALVFLGIVNLRDRLGLKPMPDDGVQWEDTSNGVRAKAIDSNSPLSLLIRKGDYVRYLYRLGKYEKIEKAETISRYLDAQGVGSDARYVIERRDPILQSLLNNDEGWWDTDFKIIARPRELGRGLYLAFIGLVYLVIGLFVLFKQNRAELTYHFYAWSLL